MAPSGVVLEVSFDGPLGPYALTHLYKLLNLRSHARLDDLESREFGHRGLGADGGPAPSLNLFRDDVDQLRVAVVDHHGRLDLETLEHLRREVEGAVRRAGFVPLHEAEDRGPAHDAVIRLPERPVLCVRLGTPLPAAFPSSALSTMATALELRREVPGTGGEVGWRYLRRDESGVQLLQAYAEDLDVRTIAVLADHDHDPDPLVVDGARLQILAAARLADVPVLGVDPHPDRPGWRHQRIQEKAWGPALTPAAGDDLSAAQLLALGDGAEQSLDALLDKFGALDAPWELKRGLVLTAVAGLVHDANLATISGVYSILPRDGVIHDRLRDQIGDLLVGREPRPPLVPPAFGPTRHRPAHYPG